MNKIEDALYQIRLEQLEKYDDVTVKVEDSVNKITFYANGVAKKTISILAATDIEPEEPEPDDPDFPIEETTVFTIDTTILDRLNYTMPSGCTGVIWGDGSSSLEAGASHTYESHGTYTITAKWVFNAYDFYRSNSIGYSQLVPIVNITRFASVPKGTYGAYTFYQLAATSLDLSTLEVENYTLLAGFFQGCKNLTSITFGDNFDTSNVTDMSSIFWDCESLTSLDLSNWDTSKVTNMSNMFYNCKLLTSLDLSSFDTSKVTNIKYMFSGCEKLTNVTIPLKENYVYNFSNFFRGCTSLVDFNFNCKPVASNIYNMFGDIQATDTQLSGWLNKLDLSQVECISTFIDNKLVSGSFIINLVKEHEQTITNFESLFEGTSVETLDLSDWNTSKITNMHSMFSGCVKLTTLNLSGWDTSQVTNLGWMFAYDAKLNSLNLSGWDTSNVTDMNCMFYYCYGFETLDVSSFDASNATNMAGMFDYCYALTNLNPPKNISSSLSFRRDDNLTYDSLKAIINNLAEVETAETLTLSSTNLSLLTIEDIAIGTSKGWNIVS